MNLTLLHSNEKAPVSKEIQQMHDLFFKSKNQTNPVSISSDPYLLIKLDHHQEKP